MHILQITIFFKRGAAYTKGCYSQNMVRCLGRISHYAFRKMMCNFEEHILHDCIYYVFVSKNTYYNKYRDKGIACARGFIWHRSRHGLLQSNALPFEKMHMLKGALTSKESFKVFEHVLTEGFGPIMSISTPTLQTHWLPVFLQSLVA